MKTEIPVMPKRRIVRRGRVVAVDTGADVAHAKIFAVDCLRAAHLDGRSGLPA